MLGFRTIRRTNLFPRRFNALCNVFHTFQPIAFLVNRELFLSVCVFFFSRVGDRFNDVCETFLFFRYELGDRLEIFRRDFDLSWCAFLIVIDD